ncbi:hypothetical protein Ddye_016125 [Dipteronia dyeriana]|uniref:Uncharacterized protein n=1 Tax=Dipteronia dyeriana TaxID=168575 RepID=A0AAD9U6U9_9ROSI|nr:hypothetical protein Ddye_016125 [Dipteronia dyeriana]
MDPTKLVITYGGKWVGNFYEGGETEFVKVCRNLTYNELSRVVQGVTNVDLTRLSIELRTLVDTGDPTINEFLAEPYNEDKSSIPEYNSHSEYGLEDFDEDYIGDGESREGVNDEATYHHGMSSNSTDGGRRESVPPVIAGLS